jgi:hypothetical protein
MHLYAIAPGYALKLANSVPTPIGPADHRQPTACATESHRFQQRFSQSKARRPANSPTQLSSPTGSDPATAQSFCSAPARQQAMPFGTQWYSMYLPEIRQKKKRKEKAYS